MIFPLLISSSNPLKTIDCFYSTASGRKWGSGVRKNKIKLLRNQQPPWFCASSPHARSLVNGCTKQQAVAVIANPPAPCNVS